MAAETLPGWFTACSDLESSNSVLLMRQGIEREGKELSAAQLRRACASTQPRSASCRAPVPKSCAQRTSAELKFISWEHLCHSMAQYDYTATSSVLKTLLHTLCDSRANAKMFTS